MALPELACHDVRVDDDTNDLGQRIRAARERRHWSQADLAKAVGVKSVRTIGSWERGETVPMNRLAALEEVLGVRLTTVAETRVDDAIVVRIQPDRRLTDEQRRVAEASARAAAEAAMAAFDRSDRRSDRSDDA